MSFWDFKRYQNLEKNICVSKPRPHRGSRARARARARARPRARAHAVPPALAVAPCGHRLCLLFPLIITANRGSETGVGPIGEANTLVPRVWFPWPSLQARTLLLRRSCANRGHTFSHASPDTSCRAWWPRAKALSYHSWIQGKAFMDHTWIQGKAIINNNSWI